ncbi:MAG: hypothetical protein KAU16_06775 [Methanophagales archaeon]|nr:hypothetical protein [Methanophagales archaeon]
MEFPYQKEGSRIFGEIYRPIVEFEIETEELGWTRILAYTDSGADVTLLPLSFIRALKIRVEEEDIKEIRGIGAGKISVIIKEVRMKLVDKMFKAKVAIALIEDVPYLLGREDVFKHFEICFRKNKVTSFEGVDM